MVVGAASRMESIHSNRGIISRTYTLMGRCVASAIDSRFYRKLCTSRHVEKKGSGKSSRQKLRSLGEQATDIMDLVCLLHSVRYCGQLRIYFIVWIVFRVYYYCR